SSIDTFVPLYDLDAAFVSRLPREPKIFFSVTNATRGAVPASWWGGSAPSGATILSRRWDGATGAWRDEPPLYTHADLFDPAGRALPRNAEIDARSVRWEETTSEAHVILSLSRPTTPSGLTQILYVKERSDSGTGELVDLTENDGGGGTQTVAQGSGVGPRGEVVGT